jgi:hypothetical protein
MLERERSAAPFFCLNFCENIHKFTYVKTDLLKDVPSYYANLFKMFMKICKFLWQNSKEKAIDFERYAR